MPGKREPPTRPKHDASYKNFFTHPRTIADTVRAVAGDLSRHLDFTTLERMPASFVTEHLSLSSSTTESGVGPRQPTSATCSVRCPANCLGTVPATGIFSSRSSRRTRPRCRRATCSR